MRRYRRRESGGGSSATAGTAPTSSNVRRSSRPFTSSAAAAEFWSNFNYVDVVSGDDTSHRRLRKRKQSVAVPRFSLDRRSSESRTIGSDSAGAGVDGLGSGSEADGAADQPPADPDHPYPEYAKYSFNCMDQKSPLRLFCIKMITYPTSTKRYTNPTDSSTNDPTRPEDRYQQLSHNNDT